MSAMRPMSTLCENGPPVESFQRFQFSRCFSMTHARPSFSPRSAPLIQFSSSDARMNPREASNSPR
jgi:hypothetical protein